jgi:DNA-binding transcriptional MerR regulator
MSSEKLSQKIEAKSPVFFESVEVSEVVGIPPIYLNKLIERGKYGIVPSIRSGRGRGSRRLFSEEDVYGIALVWWLFEAGLRAEAIQDALAMMFKVPKGKSVSAVDAAMVLMTKVSHAPKVATDIDMIVIRREPRTDSRGSNMNQEVFLAGWEGANHIAQEKETASVLFIPFVGRFRKLRKAMQNLNSFVQKPERSE